ncbi:MAG TPA: glycoside hydrolase family 31 protein [Chryseolinea sp.]|nr:glycoside hydrolase family 31 protein [Chryseolinea sp.]
MAEQFNSSRSHSLGDLTEWKQENYGLAGETTYGKFKISVYNDNIVRIQVTKENIFENFSYSVVANPQPETVTIEDHTDSLVLKTSALILAISKSPVRFSFYTLHDQLINEDDTFGTSWNGEQVTTYKKLQEGERFIGLGEKTGPLDRKGHGYENWNTDNYAYSPGGDPLYCSIPFYIGVHRNLSYGVFFDNTYKSFFNFGASNNRFASFAADTGEMNYYFIYDHSVAEIIKQYTHITGRMEMPPLWSIGYQQCRYSYYPDKEVLNLAKTFREKDIPADVIVLDIHYMESYKIFTWSKRDFPDPKKMLEELKGLGYNVVVICDPGIKVEEGYHSYEDGLKENIFIKYPDGTNYAGQVWPGWCHFPDFTNPKAREWWKEQFKDYVNVGVTGFWNDMNEIASWGNMLPENMEMDFEGNKASMRRARNIYGFQMARSSYEAAKSLLKNKRPFNLTRSGFSGIQRYSAVWTGDNVAYDEHMLLGVRLVSSMGLTGIAFAGYDVGGFVGEASIKLFARWISLGAFSPFFRGHSMINTRDSEPWAYGEEVEQISRNYIKFRYQLLPYIYSLFYEAATTGMPVQRSLAIDYTHDHKIYNGLFHNQYLFGPYFLIAPVESNKEFVKIYLPEGLWYYLYDGKKYAGNSEMIVECPVHKLPVFVKAGAVVPMQPIKSHTGEITQTCIFHIYTGDSSTFNFYEDDGLTFDYQHGVYALRNLSYDHNKRTLLISAVDGKFTSTAKRLKLIFHGLDESTQSININGADFSLKRDVNMSFVALEKFDPVYDPEPAPTQKVHTVDFEYVKEEVVVRW